MNSKDLEGSVCGIIDIMEFPEGTQEHQEKQPRYLVSRSIFEQSTSQIKVWTAIPICT
jgi:hypothetical protein